MPINTFGGRLPDGRIPSAEQVKADPSLNGLPPSPPNVTEANAAQQAVLLYLGLTPEKIQEVAANMYKAHKKALADGLLDWSESNYLRYALGLVKSTDPC